MSALPRIGLMLGDVTGIGPEISARLLAAGTFKPLARIVVIGDARVLQLGAEDAGVDLKWKNYADVDAIDWSRDEVPLVDLANIDATTEQDIHHHMRDEGCDPDDAIRDEDIISPAIIRKRLGLSQRYFAEAIHVPVATLQNWEHGRPSWTRAQGR